VSYTEGSYFGDIQLFHGLKSNFDYIVETQNCTLFSLPKDRLDEALKIYPQYLAFYQQRALRRYHYIKSIRDEVREEVFHTFD